MYGKLFASLYTGSMIGAGAVPFALMPYIIANSKPDRNQGGFVELNPVLLATIFGVSEKEVEDGIAFLCAPDPKSRTPDEQGRRLIKLGPFDYKVVNFEKYRKIRDEEERREQNRINQENFRAKQREKALRRSRGKGPLPGEETYVKNVENNGQEAADSALNQTTDGTL